MTQLPSGTAGNVAGGERLPLSCLNTSSGVLAGLLWVESGRSPTPHVTRRQSPRTGRQTQDPAARRFPPWLSVRDARRAEPQRARRPPRATGETGLRASPPRRWAGQAARMAELQAPSRTSVGEPLPSPVLAYRLHLSTFLGQHAYSPSASARTLSASCRGINGTASATRIEPR